MVLRPGKNVVCPSNGCMCRLSYLGLKNQILLYPPAPDCILRLYGIKQKYFNSLLIIISFLTNHLK